jgi:hypothetical protein
VEPPILQDPEEEPTPDYISRAIIDTISFTEGIPAKVWFEGSRPHETHCRKLAIRLMWELTSLNQTSIPQFFGYTSGGMTNNALHYTAKNYPERVRQLLGPDADPSRPHAAPGEADGPALAPGLAAQSCVTPASSRSFFALSVSPDSAFACSARSRL